MKSNMVSVVGMTVLSLLVGSVAIAGAGGGKNAYSNPTGDPAEETFLTPYMNVGAGRLQVACADSEEMQITPAADGSLEIVCLPADE